MTSSTTRYAVYYALPRDSALWQQAQLWLGRDCESGKPLTPPELEGWTAEEIAEITASPRRYGFHATLKAPFRLAPGVTAEQLREHLAAFAASRPAFTASPLKVSTIGPFLALTLSTPSPEMEALAAAAVRTLDDLRAPLSEAETARRLASGLSPRQQELLQRWGYPYVMEEFRFHMTLTGPIAGEEPRERLQTQLAALFRPLLGEPIPVAEICLYSQKSGDAPFALIERIALTAPPARTSKPEAVGQAPS